MVLLEKALTLERVGEDEFRSKSLWKPVFARGVFGGQMIGQALVACKSTVSRDYPIHSLHCYFVDRGDPNIPISYRVRRLRDGKSFTVRSTEGFQNGKVVFSMSASFHRPEEQEKLSFQYTMPVVPPPENLPSREDFHRQLLERENVPNDRRVQLQRSLAQPFPLEMRFCQPQTVQAPRLNQKAHQCIWVRTKGRLGDDPRAHQCVAAYLSDFSLLETCLLPLGLPNRDISMLASLDHAIWFHSPFRADEWMLYDMEATRAAGSRALCSGRLFRQDGTLAVSVSQEGLFRFGSHPVHDNYQSAASKL